MNIEERLLATTFGLTEPQQRFLKFYRITASISRAAEATQLARTSHYMWLKDPEYLAEFTEAQKEAAQVLEDEAVRRAYEGNEEPQFYQGKIVGHVKRYSDLLLIFLMKGAMPEKYKDRQSVELGRGPTLAELLTAESEPTRALNPAPDDGVQQTIAATSAVDDANKDT